MCLILASSQTTRRLCSFGITARTCIFLLSTTLQLLKSSQNHTQHDLEAVVVTFMVILEVLGHFGELAGGQKISIGVLRRRFAVRLWCCVGLNNSPRRRKQQRGSCSWVQRDTRDSDRSSEFK